MRCHFWVNGRNSPPLAYTSASCIHQSTLALLAVGVHWIALQQNSLHPWPTSNPTLRDIRPTMALHSCIWTGEKDRQGRILWEASNQWSARYCCCLAACLSAQWLVNECWTLERRSKKYELQASNFIIPNVIFIIMKYACNENVFGC